MLLSESVWSVRTALEEADLILFVLECNEELHSDDRALMKQLRIGKSYCYLNKTDLPVADWNIGS